LRGDVVALGFLQTRIMEMSQPNEVNEQDDPGMWVRARQFTRRIVTVTNDKVFEEPIDNFTREFPFIWEQLTVRFVLPARGIRHIKDPIARSALRGFDAAGIEIASATMEVTVMKRA
jgi:small-conductance mechanosensitive channel